MPGDLLAEFINHCGFTWSEKRHGEHCRAPAICRASWPGSARENLERIYLQNKQARKNDGVENVDQNAPIVSKALPTASAPVSAR